MNAYRKPETLAEPIELASLRAMHADAQWRELCDRLAELAAARAEQRDAPRTALAALCETNGIDTSRGLSEGLVHHFNNVLTGIVGASRLASGRLECGDPARPYVDEIHALAERGVKLGSQLLESTEASRTERAGARRATTPLRVLVVEDERLIRITLKHELQALGHHVESAADGHDAARMIEACAQPFDLLLSDVVVPGPTGPEIAKLALSKWPKVRVVLMSAYPHDVLLEQGRIEPGQVTLEKPFTEEDLQGALRKLWDAN